MDKSKTSIVLADMHLKHDVGLDNDQRSFLQGLKNCRSVFLLGDIFNFYFPLKDLVPDSFNELFAILREISKETDVYYMKGNHDLWPTGKWKDAGVMELDTPNICEIDNRRILMMHGDELFNHEMHNRHIRNILSNSLNIELFSLIPHKWAYSLGSYVASNFEINADTDDVIANTYELAKKQLKDKDCDTLIMGHIHKQHISSKGDFAITGPFRDGYYIRIDNKGVRGEHI